MQLLTSQKNQIYNYLTRTHYFSPTQFKFDESEYKGKITTSLKFINSEYYFNFIEDSQYEGFYLNYSPGQELIKQVTTNVNWDIGFDHFITCLGNLHRELLSPNLWERFQTEITEIQLISNFDNSKFTNLEYEELIKKLDYISEKVNSIPMLEYQKNEIIISLQRLEGLAKELNRFDWKNLFIGTMMSVIIQLKVNHENTTIIWNLIKDVFNDYFLH